MPLVTYRHTGSIQANSSLENAVMRQERLSAGLNGEATLTLRVHEAAEETGHRLLEHAANAAGQRHLGQTRSKETRS